MSLEFPTLDEPVAAPAQELAPIAAAALDLSKVNLTDVALAQFGDWRGEVAESTKKLTGLVLDLSNKAKIADAKSLREREVNAPLARHRKTSKALKSKLNSVSGEVGEELTKIEADYAMVAQLITPQIEAREAEIAEEERIAAEKESARKAAHETELAKLASYAEQARGLSSERISKGIAFVTAIVIDRAAWEEFADRAEEQKAVTLERMQAHHDAVKASEEETARLEARRIENERIAAELEKQRLELSAQKAEVDRQAKVTLTFSDWTASLSRYADRPAVEIAAALMLVRENAPREELFKDQLADADELWSRVVEALESQHKDATEKDAAIERKLVEEQEALGASQTPAEPQASVDLTSAASVALMASEILAQAAAPAKTVIGIDMEEAPAFVPPAPSLMPTLTLGTICERLGFTVRADFLAGLGFNAQKVKASMLYQESDWEAICDAICSSVQAAKTREEVAA